MARLRTPSWRTDKRSAHERGYTAAWRKARDRYLQDHPLCIYCQEDGRVEAATVVNHVIPHQGDQKLFWDESNWAAVCKPHHDSTIAREEARGVRIGGDETGQPLDPKHHWNK
ncbi:HNH endonuclease signature motif containing protein [Castellaniella hirudinis]|uniref:HNH endonuclease signature motif containing protein n=1 Tax=Castellaniella hirudinis TaxID=1144617 RepID=UPI0039C43DB8